MTTANRSLSQKAAGGVAWITSFQVGRQLLQIVSVSILARHIPPGVYGVVGMAVLVMNLLETVRDMGTGAALIREREMPDDVASTGFWLNCMTGATVTLVLVLLARPAAHFFDQPQVATILYFLAISFFLAALSVVPMALLSRAMEFRKMAFAQAIGAVCATVVAISVALAGGKVSALVAANLVANLATTVAVWIFSPLRVRAIFRVEHARRILSFGLHLSGSHVFNFFSRNADNVLVARFLGSTPLGYYQMGYTLMVYPLQSFAMMVEQVLYPALAVFSDDHARLRAAYLRTFRLIAFVTFPAMFGLAVTAQPFVRVFLGPQWLPVAGLLLVFAPLGALQALYVPINLIFSTQGRTDILFRWQVFASISYVLSFIVGLRWGIMGVATSYAIVWIVLMFPSFGIPLRLVGLSLKTFFASLWPTTWHGLVMVAVAGIWLHGLRMLGIRNAAIQLVTTSLIGAMVYIGLVLWCKPPVLYELTALLQGSSSSTARVVGGLLAKATAGTPNLGGDEQPSS